MNFTLKKLTIKNFKNINQRTIVFDQKTEVFGPNRTGKTAILEALKFNINGGKAFADRVSKQNTEKAETHSVFEEKKTGLPLEIWRSITQDGAVQTKVLYQGISPSKPAAFISKLVSAGSFDPRELLKKEGRTDRLMQLLPIKAEREHFDYVPLHEPDSIDYSKHAFSVITAADKDLRNTRLNLYQKKDLLNKALEKNETDYENRKSALAENFPKVFEDTISYEDKVKEHGAIIEKINELTKQKEAATSAAMENKNKLYDLNNIQNEENIKRKTNLIHEKEKEIQDLKHDIKELQSKAVLNIEKEKEVKKEIETQEQKAKETYEKINELKLQNAKAKSEYSAIKERDSLLETKESLNKEKLAVHEAIKEWKDMDIYIKKEWPLKKKQILNPMTKQVPGLEWNENGELELNGVLISALSESEVIELAINLLNLDKTTSVIAIDGAEALDKETAGNINWGDKSILLVRVGDSQSKNFKPVQGGSDD